MPWTNFPNGVSVTTATGTVAGRLNATSVVSENGLNYGGRVCLAFGGSAEVGLYTVAGTSALYDSGATIRAPFKCVAEIVYTQHATASIAVSVRVCAGSVSTATAVTTLTVGNGTTSANTTYTTIGGTALGQGSFLHLTSAIQATANSHDIMVNLIPVA